MCLESLSECSNVRRGDLEQKVEFPLGESVLIADILIMHKEEKYCHLEKSSKY